MPICSGWPRSAIAMLTCQGRLLPQGAAQVLVVDACIRTMMYARDHIHGQMDVTTPPDFLQRSRKASPAISGPYKIPTPPPYNPPVPLHRKPFGANCRLPIGCIGRQRHPPQSGYRTRPYSVSLNNQVYTNARQRLS